MNRQHLYAIVIAVLLVGSGCGFALDDAGPDARGSSDRDAAAEAANDRDYRTRARSSLVAAPECIGELVERVELLPVETEEAAGEACGEIGECEVFDLLVELDAEQWEQLVSSREADGDPIPMPADPEEEGGEYQDGDPIPMPADPEEDGEQQDGDPIPMPAEWFSGEDEETYMIMLGDPEFVVQTEESVTVVYTDIGLPPVQTQLLVSIPEGGGIPLYVPPLDGEFP